MEEITFGTLVLKYIWLLIALGFLSHIIAIKNAGKKLKRNECGVSEATGKFYSYIGPCLGLFSMVSQILIHVFGNKMDEKAAVITLCTGVIPYLVLSFLAFKMTYRKIVVNTEYLQLVKIFSKRNVSYSKITKMIVNKKSGTLTLRGTDNFKLIGIQMSVENYPILLKQIKKHGIPVVIVEFKEGRRNSIKDLEDDLTSLD